MHSLDNPDQTPAIPETSKFALLASERPAAFFCVSVVFGPPIGNIILMFSIAIQSLTSDQEIIQTAFEAVAFAIITIPVAYLLGVIPAFSSAIILYFMIKKLNPKTASSAISLALFSGLVGTAPFDLLIGHELFERNAGPLLFSPSLSRLSLIGGASAVICFWLDEHLARRRAQDSHAPPDVAP